MLLMDSVATGQSLALWRVPCKSWSCPKCAKKKAGNVAHKARINFIQNQMRFLTLTIRPRGSIPEALTHINAAWNRLRVKITRKVGKVKYVKVLESQSVTKMPHLHILLTKSLPTAWLNEAVQQAGFGPIHKIKMVRNDQIYTYIIKYLSKGIHDDAFLNALLLVHGRRFSFSQRLIPYEPQTTLHPVSIHNTGNRDLLSSLMQIHWFAVSISSGYFPLSITDNIVYFFKPSHVPLLPAPPIAGKNRLSNIVSHNGDRATGLPITYSTFCAARHSAAGLIKALPPRFSLAR